MNDDLRFSDGLMVVIGGVLVLGIAMGIIFALGALL